MEFLEQVQDLVEEEKSIGKEVLTNADGMQRLKRLGFSDAAIAWKLDLSIEEVREARWSMKLHPCYYQA